MAKLDEMEIAENVGVFDDAHRDQAAAAQQIKRAAVHESNRTGHLGLRQNERWSEVHLFEGVKIRLARGADAAGHQHLARAGIAGVFTGWQAVTADQGLRASNRAYVHSTNFRFVHYGAKNGE